MFVGTDSSHRVVPCRAVPCRAEPCRPTEDKGCSINAPLPSPAIPGKGGPETEQLSMLLRARQQLRPAHHTQSTALAACPKIKYGTGLVSLESATLLLKTTSHRPWSNIAERIVSPTESRPSTNTMRHRLLTTSRSFDLKVSPHLYT